jgi:hypothetical protein
MAVKTDRGIVASLVLTNLAIVGDGVLFKAFITGADKWNRQ